jgi:hypothetical protein
MRPPHVKDAKVRSGNGHQIFIRKRMANTNQISWCGFGEMCNQSRVLKIFENAMSKTVADASMKQLINVTGLAIQTHKHLHGREVL